MRHRKKGRYLGRTPSHRKAMLRNLASSLFLSERRDEVNEQGEEYQTYDVPGFGRNVPKTKGRIVTTVPKAKEVRRLVEKCITIARRALPSLEEANRHATAARKRSDEWERWRKGDGWKNWNQAMAPVLAARRRTMTLLGSKYAVKILFDVIAPRYADRPGGYTRIMRLAKPRLGDAGDRAILEFVTGTKPARQKSQQPAVAVESGDAGQ